MEKGREQRKLRAQHGCVSQNNFENNAKSNSPRTSLGPPILGDPWPDVDVQVSFSSVRTGWKGSARVSIRATKRALALALIIAGLLCASDKGERDRVKRAAMTALKNLVSEK